MPAGDRPAVSATTTTTVTTISSSRYWGRNVLYHNNGDGTFTDVTDKAGVTGRGDRWGAGCAFLDFDRDGHLDLFVANYVNFDPAKAPRPGTGRLLQLQRHPRAVRPAGIRGRHESALSQQG